MVRYVRVEWYDVQELNGTICKSWMVRCARVEWYDV